MGPVRQNPIHRTVSLCMYVCIALCTVAHNIAQNRPDSFPPYPPDNHHCSNDVYLREGGVTTSAASTGGVYIMLAGCYLFAVHRVRYKLHYCAVASYMWVILVRAGAAADRLYTTVDLCYRLWLPCPF